MKLDKVYMAEIDVCYKCKSYGFDGVVYTMRYLKSACVYYSENKRKYIDLLTKEEYRSEAHDIGDKIVYTKTLKPFVSFLDDIPKNRRMPKWKVKQKVLSMKLNEKIRSK